MSFKKDQRAALYFTMSDIVHKEPLPWVVHQVVYVLQYDIEIVKNYFSGGITPR